MYGCRTISLNFHLGRGKEQPEKIDEWRHRFRTQREEARLSKFRHIFMLIGLPSANRGIYPFYMNLDLEEHGRVLTFRTVSRYGLSDASKKSTFQLFDRILLPEVDTPWNGITLSRLVDAILCDIPSKLQCDVDSLSGKLVVTYTQQAYPRGLRVRKREKWGSALYEDSTVIEKEEFIESSQE